jgi:putative DNA primase/helicase
MMKNTTDIYVENGIRLFPISGNTKVAAKGWKWKEMASNDAGEIGEFIDQNHGCNIGAVIDEGFVVIDIDAKGDAHKHDGIQTFTDLIKQHGQPQATMTVRTPSGGLHLYFRSSNPNISASSTNINGLMGIDIKSNGGGYVVAAGSSIDGNFYEVVNDSAIAELPEWLEKLIEKPVVESKPKPKQLPRPKKYSHSMGASTDEEHIQAALECLNASDFDGDYDGWLKIGMAIHSALPDDAGKALWDDWSQGGSSYDKAAIESSWKSFKPNGDITLGTLFYMAGYTPSHSKNSSSGVVFIPDMEMNDTGLAYRLIDRYGQKIKYVSDLNSWLIWDKEKSVWLKNSNAIKQLKDWHKELIDDLVIDTSTISGDDKEVMKKATSQNNWLRYQLDQRNIYSVRSALSERTAIAITELDQNRRLVGVENGVIDLKNDGSYVFRQQTPDDLVTKSMHVVYSEDAACPKFESFLEMAMQGDKDKIAYFQVWLGYCLTGEVSEPIINFLYGSGKNGKSVFADTIISLFGDYAIKINSETFMKNKMGVTSNAAMSDLAQMHGARLVISDEVPTDASFNTKVIKSIVGESTVTAKFLHKNTFNYQSTAKILLYGNDKVYGDHSDDGFWRRMKLINFGYIVPDHLVNKNLLKELKQEFSGILNWALQGYTKWASNSNGLVVPDVIEEATTEYRKSVDTVAQFLDYKFNMGELFITNDDSSRIVLSELRPEYEIYCDRESLIKVTNPSRFKKSIDRYFDGNPDVHIKLISKGNAVFGLTKEPLTNQTQKVTDLSAFQKAIANSK